MSHFEKISDLISSLDSLVKHFGATDIRQPSFTHNVEPETQQPHGNRPGQRTQQTMLSAANMLPDGFDDLDALAQANFFLRATNLSSPVVQVGDRYWLAPPGAGMLPERGAGENVRIDEVNLPAGANVGGGLDPRDELDLPAPADSEEGKRFLEAAAEHRKNDYQGPTTPRLEEMFGDLLRRNHPKRASKSYTPRITPSKQRDVVRSVVQRKKSQRLGLPLQKMQAINAFINVFQTSPRDILEQEFITDLMDMFDPRSIDLAGSRSETTAQNPTGQAQQNVQSQQQGTKEQQQARQQRENQRRTRDTERRSRRLRKRL